MIKKIRVSIKCRQLVRYYQIVEMDKEDYELVKDLDLDDIDIRQPEYDIIEKYLNTDDIFDTDAEFTNVQVIKEKNQPHDTGTNK